jgi:stage V sporulation protein B
MAEAKSQAVSAGRGVVYIAFAKVYFLVAGAAIEFGLARIVGPYLYGAYSVVAAWVSNINNVMVTGTIQAVSRQTTAAPERADDVKSAGIRMHLVIGLPLAILYSALAPVWARLVHDPEKTGLFALSGGIVAAYAFYTVFVGSANGVRAFHKQAGLDITFATLRAGGILGAALVGLGVWGAVAAWVAAAGAILCIAAVWVGPPRSLRAGEVRPMATFLGGVALYLILINLLMSVDQLLLKRLSTEWFHAHPDLIAVGKDASDMADQQVGFYRAVQNLARLPYQLLIAATFVVFPLVSRSTFEHDLDKTRGYIGTTLRYSLIFSALMGAVLAANPTALMLVPYGAAYAVGGPALAALALGNVAFAVFTISGTILNSAGRTRDAVIVALVTLAASTIALWVGIPRAAPGETMLLVCGAATASAMLVGAAASGWLLWRRFGAFIPVLTIVRVGVATVAAVAVGRVLPAGGKLVTLGEGVACAAAFLGVLVATGELRRADLAAIRGGLRRES